MLHQTKGLTLNEQDWSIVEDLLRTIARAQTLTDVNCAAAAALFALKTSTSIAATEKDALSGSGFGTS